MNERKDITTGSTTVRYRPIAQYKSERTHTGYGIQIESKDGMTNQYRHFSAENYHLTERDAITMAEKWSIRDTDTITVLDEGISNNDFAHRVIYRRPSTDNESQPVKEQRVNFRSSEAERETLAALARYHGISLTDVLHMLIAKAAREAGIAR